MLTFLGKRTSGKYCDGMPRRDFMRIGSLALGGLSLADLLRARAEPAAARKDTSVILLWLEGGASHIETFNPIMHAPEEYRSLVGAVQTKLPGVAFGGLLPRMAAQADQLAIVHSFCHTESSHSGGCHLLKTGHTLPPSVPRSQEATQARPSMGSIVSAVRGANHPASGVPTYIETPSRSGRKQGAAFSGSASLGGGHQPFRTDNADALNDMLLRGSAERLQDRRELLRAFDQLERSIDQSGQLESAAACEQQAFQVLAGRVRDAFDLSREERLTREKYGKDLGERLLLARRLCEAGAGFVTVYHGDWDMHSNFGPMTRGLERQCPPLDHAVAAFLEDLHQRGQEKNILLVITGEFGRGPKIGGQRGGASFGREHWPELCTLALAGGGFRMGQVIGQSTDKAERPKSNPISPQDLMTTMCHFLGIDPRMQIKDATGRPLTLFDDGKVIEDLL